MTLVVQDHATGLRPRRLLPSASILYGISQSGWHGGDAITYPLNVLPHELGNSAGGIRPKRTSTDFFAFYRLLAPERLALSNPTHQVRAWRHVLPATPGVGSRPQRARATAFQPRQNGATQQPIFWGVSELLRHAPNASVPTSAKPRSPRSREKHLDSPVAVGVGQQHAGGPTVSVYP